jgi:hypothetical protein
MPAPTPVQQHEWFERLEAKIGQPLGVDLKSLVRDLKTNSFSDLEQFCEDIQRRYVLALPEGNLQRIVLERLDQWRSRVTVDPAQDGKRTSPSLDVSDTGTGRAKRSRTRGS